MQLIVADVGGTNTRLARAEYAHGTWHLHAITRYPSREYPGPDAILADWLARPEQAGVQFRGAGLAVAGPVHGEHARVTNLDWPALTASDLAASAGVPVALLNDFAAVGACLEALTPEDRLILQQGEADPSGPRLVTGAGTGLGTCLVTPNTTGDGEPVPPAIHPGEGGHARFSPADAEENELAAFVTAEAGLCTREHLLSGRGIARIGRFELERRDDPELGRALAAAEPAAAISTLADTGHAAALAVIRRFVTLYAGQLADMALTALPRGGVFIGGGIAPRWADHFLAPAFREAFRARPPMEDLLERLPVELIIHPEPGLLGAAVAASRARDHGAPAP
ncbi:glucokinase [Thioalkalivibrio sp. ALJ24]|uniref:glucokinase n=1 Tax=Thioalkalivibrio sp. ALJ24 TaxID=545276 RepID=UPI0004773AE5|nr:glucokinase [Thioalkalivibrio sp. ALJ24]